MLVTDFSWLYLSTLDGIEDYAKNCTENPNIRNPCV